MSDLRIVIWPFKKSKKWYRTLVSKLICFFTDSNYTHSAIAIDGIVYESTVMNNQNGAMRTVGLPYPARNCIHLKFKVPLPKKEIELLEYNLNRKVIEKRPYNFMKILVLMFVYPTKKFWNWIGWVPFQNEVYGSVCSVFVDVAFKEIGIDLIFTHNEEYTAPVDILHSSLLELIV